LKESSHKPRRPSREEKLLSDTVFHFAGFSFTTFQLLLAGALLLMAAALLLFTARGKRVALQRSVVTDELMVHLARIGDSLDQITSELRAASALKETQTPESLAPLKTGGPAQSIAYSMFGR
jgi:hypothetical protein